MKPFNILFAVFYALIVRSSALQDSEEPCPGFSGNDCFNCVTAGCGYVTNRGYCVQDCLAVTGSGCYSTSGTEFEISQVCSLFGSVVQSGASTSETSLGNSTQQEVAEDEEACPTVAVRNDCVSCVTASCGYVTDEGNCVKDCLTVMDSECFSTEVAVGSVAEICALAAEAQNGTSTIESETSLGDSTQQEDFGAEVPCPGFSGVDDCSSCVTAGCGYAIDHGDCVMDCRTVLDSECFSTAVTGGEVEDICASAAEAQDAEAQTTNATPQQGQQPPQQGQQPGQHGQQPAQHGQQPGQGAGPGGGGAAAGGGGAAAGGGGGGEQPCPGFSGEDDCFSCVTAGCGYAIDHGDCVEDCLTVQDTECFSTAVTGGEVTDICASAAEAQAQSG